MADQRIGTARVLVLIASAAVFAAGGVVCFLVLLFGPTIKDGDPVAGTVAYTALSLATAGGAVAIAVRAATTKRVVLGGCGTLLVGTLVAAGAMVLLVTG
ncbi:hypothetical protein [Actinokineospora cianjurensis]|uniref:Uncharacterized protein n=1 Tax=Actinokineospora cianjurensis TaxID=585224 RepID=A0A421B5T9_9PSEU|nr:hypothetical protein [Actinokineospora cianjurensis]RLK59734.1 hypothetical protein CLV68_0218 [Actinokineospora cianjurensis]